MPTHFGRLYPWSCSFGHDPPFMTICDGRNKDWPVDLELCLLAQLLSSSQWRGKANTKPLPLLRFSGPSRVPLYPHSRTRPQNTWTPSLGVRTNFLLGVDSPSVFLLDFVVLMLIPAASHLAVNRSSKCLRSQTDGCHQDHIVCKKTVMPSSGHTNCNPCPPWLRLEILSHEYHKQDSWQGAALAETNPH